MEQSMTLISAQIRFLDARLSLIHIPLPSYSFFLQGVLKLLFPLNSGTAAPTIGSAAASTQRTNWATRHPFLNVSITPVECSVVCSRALAQELFAPVIDEQNQRSRDTGELSVSTEDYVVVQVDGEGLDAGQRVLELTTPLAMAGISIFFITTYFSDYILVPLKAKGHVIQVLEQRGFRFEKSAEAFVSQAAHHRNTSSTSSFEVRPPSTPPPTSVSELQKRTFALLKRRNVFPHADKEIRLVQCAGRKDTSGGIANDELGLQLGLVKCLINKPRFLSLTLTDTEPASLLLEKSLMPEFGSDDVLLGGKEDILIPITLDLRELPLEATGIVCGVAGKVVGGTAGQVSYAVEMSYLSTARAGTVMVGEQELSRAMEALMVGEENGVLPG
ncbi:MAG: hypothetical protein M1830_010007 [Pleopsidium flavum]|nr:MAG: hypothetical protein M1830_010007 [Pleopsidium flavum]